MICLYLIYLYVYVRILSLCVCMCVCAQPGIWMEINAMQCLHKSPAQCNDGMGNQAFCFDPSFRMRGSPENTWLY